MRQVRRPLIEKPNERESRRILPFSNALLEYQIHSLTEAFNQPLNLVLA